MRRGVLGAIAATGAAAAMLTLLSAPATAQAPADGTPLYAYYYIWFNPSSWNRAKSDLPVLGRYSSDENSVMARHMRWARDAGIDGFIVSWKSTPTLDRRLGKLIDLAEQQHFRLTVIYQGLDFERRPLPASRIAADLDTFIRRWGDSPAFRGFGRPVVIWSGTWKYSRASIASVTDSRRDKLRILATERNPRDYAAKADLFDGDAYYWSSVNPDTYPRYPEKLQLMADEVHRTGGLWFAPLAPGFDARLIGGTSVVERRDGETLRRQYAGAVASDPDALGLISWNEFSENTHVEPSTGRGSATLETLADLRRTSFSGVGDLDSSAPQQTHTGLSGLGMLVSLVALSLLGVGLVRYLGRRRAGANPSSPG